MSKFQITYPPGATPLDPDETAGLIPDYITTQGELNRLERQNILEATDWALSRKHNDILNATFVLDLHRKMFNRVWKWAGKPRHSDKNIGVSKEQIHNQLKLLLDATSFWITNHTYPLGELAARFHYRLVWIHAFPNGNGRHGRLMTDVLLESNGAKTFSWGSTTSTEPIEVEGPLRDAYIKALQAADKKNFSLLLKFVRS